MDSRRRVVTSTFKLHGFNLRSDACTYLLEVISQVRRDRGETLSVEKIIEHIQSQSIDTPAIERSHIEAAVKECVVSRSDEPDRILNIISGYEAPRLAYNAERGKMAAVKPERSIFKFAQSKSDMFRNRYILLRQRIMRRNIFSTSSRASGAPVYTLSTMEMLKGTTTRLDHVVCFGMITQLQEGKFHLEDITGFVQINLSETRFQSGLFTENCFVIAEGWYDDEVFHVKAMGFPPPEASSETRKYFGNVNFFGGPSPISCHSCPRMISAQQKMEDAMVIFLSEIYLDEPKVTDKLRVLFQGYSECPPACFVLMGNFLRHPYGSHVDLVSVQSHFSSLAQMIQEFPSLVEKSQFVFVPGPMDPGFTHVYPRSPLPDSVVQPLKDKVLTAIFTTNPCRLQCLTREIVIWRDDVISKMCRNALYFPSDAQVPDLFAKTVISQSHLSPLPLHVSTLHWNFDQAMYLYPLPDLVVVGDAFGAYEAPCCDCNVINPGMFSSNDYSFKVYFPATGIVEDSQIPND